MIGARQGLLFVAFSLFAGAMPAHVFAQEPVTQAAPAPVPEESRKAAFAKFLAGAAVGAGLHEAGHAAAGWDRYQVSRPRTIAVTSAGFWAQYLTSETVLTSHPQLRSEQSPFRKGVVAFHLAASAGYAVLAITQTGPYGRDTLEMARARGVKLGSVALVLG